MAVSSSSRPVRMPELQSTKLWKELRGEISPDRTVVRTEPSSNGKLKTDKESSCRLLSLEDWASGASSFHGGPSFISTFALSQRLNVLRGKGMSSMYSWSCKRNYKNGFVWHDLSENDLIYPAHGNEYVLKGSGLLETTFTDTLSSFQKQQAQPLALPQPPPPPPPVGDNQITGSHDLEYLKASEDRRRRNQSCSSIEFNLHEYSVYKAETSSSTASRDASTQTEDKRRHRRPPGEIVEVKDKEPHGEDEIEISPPTSDSSPETLETLMKAGKRLMIPETSSEDPTSSNHRAKDKPSSVLMQLISCGSISFKDCGTGQGLGLISQYKMRLPRVGGTVGRRRVKLEEKEYLSGSIVETKKEEFPSLKRSTSYGAERSSQLEIPEKEIRAKCLSRKPKTQHSQSSTQKEAKSFEVATRELQLIYGPGRKDLSK